MSPRRRVARALFALSFAAACIASFAAPFTQGNVVVYRIGNGSATLSANGNAAFLEEFNAAGALVQPAIALPTAASGAQRAFVGSGTATTDGLLSRSADGACLAVPGYGRDLGTGSGNLVSGSIAGGGAIPRVVARVSATGAIDTSTALTDAAVAGNFRSAASADCASFWVAGNPGGVRYATLGATTSNELTSGSFANVRSAIVQGGQLYGAASVTAFKGVATVGGGMPTSGAQAATRLPGLTDTNSPSPSSFFFADLDGVPGIDTLYVADDGAGALSKFSLVGGTWIPRGTVGVAADVYRGIAGIVSGSTVTLFATRRTGTTATPGGELVRLVDGSGYNGTLAGTPTVIATAAPNTVYRGVTLTPELIITPSAGPNGSIAPATPQIVGGGTTRVFTVTPDAGYSVVVGGTCPGTLTGNTFTTAPATASCTVIATFTLLPTATVTPLAGPHGTLTPATPRTLLQGTTTTFQVAPDPGYSAAVSGCGGSLAGSTYTTAVLTADCTVTATFTLITFTVTPSAGLNGAIDPRVPQEIARGTSATFTVTPEHGFGASVGGTCGGTLTGNRFVTAPITGPCSVVASFAPLPRHTVTATAANGNGSIAPAGPQTVISGDSATLAVMPAPGYNAAVRGTCGGALVGATFTTAPVTRSCSIDVTFARKLVLFVGNSYTFGRVDPVMSYNTASVADLTLEMWRTNPFGSNDDEPHPWGGIPGVFKKFTDQAGLDFDVSISARNAASLRGHYLNSNPAGWDLRGNIASQRWDAVVLQELSDGALPAGRGANANLANFNTYVDRIEQYVHLGTADPGLPVNPHSRPDAQVFLYQTWARPDMIAPNGTNASGTFYTAAEGIEAMTADLHAAYFGRALSNPAIEDVAPVGDAFLRAVTDGVAMRDPYVPEAGKVNLWHTDFFHPSKYGSYLSAAVHFATLTGLNPLSLGAGEQAAADLGIAPAIAVQLQRVAQASVAPDVTAPVSSASTSVSPNAAGWNSGDVTITFTAADEARGSGLDAIRYSLAGAQAASGTLASGASLTVHSEGVTTVTWSAVDRAGNAEAAHSLRIAIDRTPPEITGMPGPECSLWPPDGKMAQVATVAARDPVSGVTSFNVSAASSETASPGKSDVAIAGSGNAARTVSLRADRLATGSGRVYTIIASAVDAAGNGSSATATCTVPHDKGR